MVMAFLGSHLETMEMLVGLQYCMTGIVAELTAITRDISRIDYWMRKYFGTETMV